MATSYDLFIRSYHKYQINDQPIGNLIEDASVFFEEYDFLKEYKEFYVKNLYTNDNKYVYFFLNNSLAEVIFTAENFSFEIINYTKISKTIVTYHNHSHLTLAFTLIDNREVVLDNKKDANEYQVSAYLKKIKSIHKILIEKGC